jgi:hypothetical protein
MTRNSTLRRLGHALGLCYSAEERDAAVRLYAATGKSGWSILTFPTAVTAYWEESKVDLLGGSRFINLEIFNIGETRERQVVQTGSHAHAWLVPTGSNYRGSLYSDHEGAALLPHERKMLAALRNAKTLNASAPSPAP